MSTKKDVVPYCYCAHFKIVIIISSWVILRELHSLSTELLVVPFLQFIKRREHLLAAATGKKTGRTVVCSSPKKATLLCITSKHVEKSAKRVSWILLQCSSVLLSVIFLDLLNTNSSNSYKIFEREYIKKTVTIPTQNFSWILRQCIGPQFISNNKPWTSEGKMDGGQKEASRELFKK